MVNSRIWGVVATVVRSLTIDYKGFPPDIIGIPHPGFTRTGVAAFRFGLIKRLLASASQALLNLSKFLHCVGLLTDMIDVATAAGLAYRKIDMWIVDYPLCVINPMNVRLLSKQGVLKIDRLGRRAPM